MSDYHFDHRFYERTPAIVIADVPHEFVCEECGLPGVSTSRNTKTHPGPCRQARARRAMARANARIKQRRAAAKKA